MEKRVDATLLQNNGGHQKRPSLFFHTQKAASSWVLCSNIPNAPYLQLPEGLEGKNLDGLWKASTRDMDQLKKKKKKKRGIQVSEAGHTFSQHLFLSTATCSSHGFWRLLDLSRADFLHPCYTLSPTSTVLLGFPTAYPTPTPEP